MLNKLTVLYRFLIRKNFQAYQDLCLYKKLKFNNIKLLEH